MEGQHLERPAPPVRRRVDPSLQVEVDHIFTTTNNTTSRKDNCIIKVLCFYVNKPPAGWIKKKDLLKTRFERAHLSILEWTLLRSEVVKT